MISDYMKQAVEAFGKPEIELLGDRTIYPNWENVPDVFPPFLFKGMGSTLSLRNLIYSVFAYMDPRFQYKNPDLAKKFLRLLAEPITDIYFQKIKKGVFDSELSQKLYELFNR